MVTQTGLRSPVRREFFRVLSKLDGPQTLNFHSLSLGMHVTPGLLSRYLREARQAGWVQTEVVLGGVKVTVLDQHALEVASGEKP